MSQKWHRWFKRVNPSETIKGWMEKAEHLFEIPMQIVGDTLEDAVKEVKRYNAQGIATTIHYQSTVATCQEEAKCYQTRIFEVISAIEREGLDADVLVSLTALGLLVNEKVCLTLTEQLAKEAKKQKIFLHIDEETYRYNESILSIYENIVKKYKKQVGLNVDISLYKSERDVQYLQKYKCHLTMTYNGIKENERVAIASKEEREANLIKLAETQMMHGLPVTIATHEEHVLFYVEAYARGRGIPREQYEFQYPYHLKKEKQREWAQKGVRVRAIIPYGEQQTQGKTQKQKKSFGDSVERWMTKLRK